MPPITNRSDEKKINGNAYFRSCLYKPGDMKSHTWPKTNGDAKKTAAISASFSSRLKPSVGLETTREETPALRIGRCTALKRLSANVQDTPTAMPTAIKLLIIRLRSSSR